MPREALLIRSKQHASHSNTARHRARLGKSQNKEFRRRGVFPFFDLPYELRHEILKLAILQETTPTATTQSRPSPSSSSSTTKKSYQQALVLFLTCRWLYEEAAAIFYQEVVLDTRASSDSGSSSSTPTPFLVRSLTPRLYVRTLRIRFYVKEYHLGLFHSVYAPILRDMAQHGRLEHLVLELGYQFPSPSFWGGGARSGEELEDADPFHDDVPIVPGRHRKDRELHAPLFVTHAPFQGFLKMLHGFIVPSSSSSSPINMKKITVYLEATDHPPFWCAFHRVHPSGRWRDLVKTFAGAQAPPTDSWGIDAI
ncbi:hypothetical protein PG984_015805 [Apiospora sp. TS-2023a]